MCVVTGCAGEWQPRVGLTSHESQRAMCTRGQSGSDTVKRSVSHCTSWMMGSVGRLQRWPGRRLGRADKSMTTFVWNVVQRSLSSLSMRQHFSLSYKTIAAGRARGLSTSRKKKKHQRKNNNYNITFPGNPHEKQAMEIHQFWEVVNVFNLFSFPLNPNLQATNIVLC